MSEYIAPLRDMLFVLRDGDDDPSFYRAKLERSRFYADHVLARAPGLAHTVVHGAAGALAIEDDQF